MDVSRAELKYLVERQREEIKAINEAGKLLTSATEPQQIVRLVASYLHRAFPVALCGILLPAQRKLHLFPFAPIPKVEIANAIRQSREAAGKVFNRPITEDESVADEVEETPADSWIQPTIALRTHFSFPLVVNDQPMGLLSLFSGQPEALTKEEQHAVGIVAEQLAASLRNAFLVQELRRADELKNQMLSIVSHELSTPLTAIKEGVTLVLDGALGAVTSDQQDFLKTVMENVARLERLLQKVKTTTELMTGQVRLTMESCDLRVLLAGIEKACGGLASARQVRVKSVDLPKPLFWQVDRNYATQALSELVENAIQATPPDGFVTLKLSATPTEASIQLVDTGRGVAKELLPTLFDRFQSIGGIHERKMGGLGLGLFIAKSLIDRHGGAIEVESTPGQGTLVTVRLPKQAQATS